MSKIKVAVAMSGGVDSSVAAALLKDKGYEVVGLTMRLWACKTAASANKKLCCSLNDTEDAKKVCCLLAVPHYTVDFRKEFNKQVIEPFCENYRRGITPNPCILCNQKIKFDLLLEKAKSLGFNFLATGHYAKIQPPFLLKGKDDNNDQSYWLYGVKEKNLKNILMPLGIYTKTQVRELARKYHLNVAGKPKSQEICFIQDNNYRNFMKQYSVKEKHGAIVDKNGKVLGAHKGVSNFTIGQRSGLGISAGKRVYVCRIVPEENKVVIGDEKDVYSSELIVKNVNWFVHIEKFPLKTKVKIRYKHKEADAAIYKSDKILYKIVFDQPQWAVTPGQSAVFYAGNKVLGGGEITHPLFLKEGIEGS
ncbi:MAG: tRNA 2-thiouridine(34) synthase MnmA [Elusimicrobia bacterium]|nr:tRNA 2-thiouridine(34) synthase MnmA [Elusimicrobiota bacterium]MBU2615180.1 tRNA 2-thiouridine(34) synthase MnmA [Elusimicrobiota bacterium]